ncbi:MAG: hypothetical protein M1826_001374 [Phylliscum demangeonii]|nr:MAG: hypothetical protein M1826_001374 [Phylliscum demangeonii]
MALAGGLSLIHIPAHLYPHFLQPILRLLFLSDEDAGDGDERGRGPAEGAVHDGDDNGRPRPGRRPGPAKEPWASLHPFVNISITPVECSVVCRRRHAEELFAPLLEALPSLKKRVFISPEDYIVMQVEGEGEGLDAGRRVVELTSPLAMAGMYVCERAPRVRCRCPGEANFRCGSIFFITTYFSDYILVPAKSRGQVSRALEDRGFVFEQAADAFVNHSPPQHRYHAAPPLPEDASHSYSHQHHRHASSTSTIDPLPTPTSPLPPGGAAASPPTNLEELQRQTFSLLRQHHVHPSVDASIQLIQCAGSKDDDDAYPSASSPHSHSHSHSHPHSHRASSLQQGLINILVSAPRFLSLTLTDHESASVLLETRLLHHFAIPASVPDDDDHRPSDPQQQLLHQGGGPGESSVLLGIAPHAHAHAHADPAQDEDGAEDEHEHEHVLIPITLDLRHLPLESTGIVCGVAGRLVAGGIVDVGYLSTARAGTVLVERAVLHKAIRALEEAEGKEEG